MQRPALGLRLREESVKRELTVLPFQKRIKERICCGVTGQIKGGEQRIQRGTKRGKVRYGREEEESTDIWINNREEKIEVKKFKLVKLWDWLEHSERNKMKNAPLSKISLLVQFGGQVYAPVCSDDSVQVLLKLAWIVTMTITPSLSPFCTNRLIFGK